jgi:hypothetical protein
LPDTTVETVTEFFIWSHSPNPHLDDSHGFGEIVNLGIFAWRYKISALSNQVTDLIRVNLAGGEWQLEAGIVDAIYQAAESSSPLREVVKAALGQVPRSTIAGEEWEKTFRNNSDLGWDCLRAGDKEWSRQDFLSGVCRFHNHDGIKRPEGLCDGCPFAEADCYPEWEEDGLVEQPAAANEVSESTVDAEMDAAAEPQEAPPQELTPEPASVKDAEPVELNVEEESAEEPASEDVLESDAPAVDDSTGEHQNEDSAVELADGDGEAEAGKDVTEDVNGTETPHVNGIKKVAATDDAQSESLYPDSLQSDREPWAAPNGNGISHDKGTMTSVTEVVADVSNVKLSKGQKKKRAKRLSISQAN